MIGGEEEYVIFWYHTESGSTGHCLCLLSARLFGLIILLTVELGRGWGLQTHAAPQKPAAPWCWSHPWWKERKMSEIRFPMLSPSHFYFSKRTRLSRRYQNTSEKIQDNQAQCEPRRQGGGTIFPPWKHFSTWIPVFSAFLSCLFPYSYRPPSVKSGSNLNSWPMRSVSPPWGGGNGVFEWWKNSSDWTHTVSFLSEVCLAVGGKVNSCFQAAVTASLILFVVHPWSSSCIVFVFCIVPLKPGIFLTFVLFFCCFFVERRSGNVEREYKGVLANMSQTNLYCNNILWLFGRRLRGFSSPLRDCDCILPYIGLCNQIKWILWGFHIYGYCIY